MNNDQLAALVVSTWYESFYRNTPQYSPITLWTEWTASLSRREAMLLLGSDAVISAEKRILPENVDR